MKIISLINNFTNNFNETFKQNLNPLNLERKIRDIGDRFNLNLYEQFLNYLDDKFKNSKERKQLKNIRYFATSKLSYEQLWKVIFDYVDKKYDIDKFKKIFVSGDGASSIKNFKNCFPNATLEMI